MTTHEERLSLDELREALQSPLQETLGDESEECRVEFLIDPKEVADDPAKLLVLDGKGERKAVVLVSSPVEPDLVGRGMRVAAEARDAIGSRLGQVILEPLGEGSLHGLSYTILPYCRPMSEGRIARWLTRRLLRSKVLNWLAETSQATSVDADAEERVRGFVEPLRHLMSSEIVQDAVREAAREALSSLEREEWKPTFVLMHGDLWEGNLLLAPKAGRRSSGLKNAPFVLIDWPGAKLRGYPFYDLLRIVRSMRISDSVLRREVARHCMILGTDSVGARGHLLACLGHTGLNLEHFPAEMYAELSIRCLNDIGKAFASDTR